MGRTIGDIERYATEIHNPEITEPPGGGDVADRNYKMLAGLGVVRGELERSDIGGFVARARTARVLADAGTHRPRRPVDPARARAHCEPATCTARC